MLKIEKFEEIEGGNYLLIYSFDTYDNEVATGQSRFATKRDAYKHYYRVCNDYILQNFDRMRLVAKKFKIKLPVWSLNVPNLDLETLLINVDNLPHSSTNEVFDNFINEHKHSILAALKAAIQIKKYLSKPKLYERT